MDFLLNALWAALVALGFGVLFNVRRRALVWCALLGAVSYSVRGVLVTGGSGLEVATLAAALVVGALAYGMSKPLRMPAPIFGIIGSIPLIPGRLAYEAMIGLLQLTTAPTIVDQQTILSEVAVNAVRVAFILAAIALGIAFPSLLLDREKAV